MSNGEEPISYADFFPGLGKYTVRRSLSKVFSREMLGAVLVGSAASKILENLVRLYAGKPSDAIIAWTIVFIITVWIFVEWSEFTN